MKEKEDLCILVGYSTQSKGYRVYNRRTRMLVESIYIRFDKIKEVFDTSVANNTSGLVPQRQKASDDDNPDPIPQQQDVYSLADAHVTSFELTAFSDADHARCIDSRKSTSGGIQFLRYKLVSWMSKKQNCTAMYSAKAEYVALSASCAQVMWMRTQLQDYGFNYNKIPSYFDSNHFACVTKMLNDVHARTKKPTVVPISTRKPKSQANKSVATHHKKQVASKSTKQKPHSYFRMLYEKTSKTWKWWTAQQSPSGYKWVPKTKEQWVPKPKMQWVPKAKNDQIVRFILFIVDSGCTKHMTGNLKLLCNFVEKFLGLNHNLFSVGQFCDEDLEVAFRKSTCFVRDLQGNDLLIGNRGSDLYTISL
uniref:Uncharacterized mitochondrial protein AtMg00810-like n=1 Tax=Tanacetum cinerariifolium TaxID=118510 RepID=A0A6L2MHN6_TANCI|nr:uncharacterized mitochondrial protein AtMg00810-like [Tanacetum cinerariifolium]